MAPGWGTPWMHFPPAAILREQFFWACTVHLMLGQAFSNTILLGILCHFWDRYDYYVYSGTGKVFRKFACQCLRVYLCAGEAFLLYSQLVNTFHRVNSSPSTLLFHSWIGQIGLCLTSIYTASNGCHIWVWHFLCCYLYVYTELAHFWLILFPVVPQPSVRWQWM